MDIFIASGVSGYPETKEFRQFRISIQTVHEAEVRIVYDK